MKHTIQPKVYLSGRLNSIWQDRVMEEIPRIEYFDPRSHKLDNPKYYTAWDMNHIQMADILFGYMEQGNPSGFGLAAEIGYAKGLGKRIMLVDEKSQSDENFSQYFAIVREMSDVVLDSLNEGIAQLKTFAF